MNGEDITLLTWDCIGAALNLASLHSLLTTSQLDSWLWGHRVAQGLDGIECKGFIGLRPWKWVLPRRVLLDNIQYGLGGMRVRT